MIIGNISRQQTATVAIRFMNTSLDASACGNRGNQDAAVSEAQPTCRYCSYRAAQNNANYDIRQRVTCCSVPPLPYRKEGRKYYICSSRLGLIRWDIIQHVKAVHDKMSNTSTPYQ